ncbi:peptidase M48-like protein [Hasllibacter halocynthiae]|uniref:Peptidase M48-like protein n=1 Tax=Hasllibacter halocynthiae TaxID=595589 RepID=A0A2T0X449_9RHOB|nr:M48 family metallopeptidase [Hasllibacter halocynthiae]PRY93710.1 peptidase M48-like protein [Hasllibacter halocynthiae]
MPFASFARAAARFAPRAGPRAALCAVLAAAGCAPLPVIGPVAGSLAPGAPVPAPVPAPVVRSAEAVPDRLPPRVAARTFAQVVELIEPVAEALCRAQGDVPDCDYQIVVDDRPGVPPNAFQTVNRQGRPVVGMTLALIAEARNADELAFILGHEMAHHIAGHLDRQREAEGFGQALGVAIGRARGLDRAGVAEFARAGALVGARRFGPTFELEADAIGTRIAAEAGFDPLRGAAFFQRIPDPGDRFLGTHPPNAARLDAVRRAAAGL